jgi:hypothetical protein
MERPSRKDIKAAVDKLKNHAHGAESPSETQKVQKLATKKTSERIRKQGV